MSKYLNGQGLQYLVDKLKDKISVTTDIDSTESNQMACVPVTGYQDEYLTLSALEDGEITITIPAAVNSAYASYLSYSKDKSEWVETVVDDTDQTITIPVSSYENVYLKGKAKQWSTNDFSSNISFDCNIIASGNIMSLLYEDNFKDKTAFPVGSQHTFRGLFKDNTSLISTENLILPATTLAQRCYHSMFQGCTSLKTAPELPATTLADWCYANMFHGCTSLTTAPELPATTLAKNCYRSMFNGCTSLTTAPELPATTLASDCCTSMFNGCTSLTTAPELPATTLASDCYYSMFQGCTSLTTAPELPATTLASRCYRYMFNGCSKLNSITMLATDISATDCLADWVGGVSSTGTFTKAASMTSLPEGVHGIPSGWTVIDK